MNHVDADADVRLVSIPTGRGIPETSATRSPSEFDEAIPMLAPGYIENEYLFVGSGDVYAGPVTGPAVVHSSGHRYRTRILTRYPQRGQRFSGRVVIEPFNTTYGVDRDALWLHVASLLQNRGDAWIGISVRASSAAQLRGYDPQRYGDLDVPSNNLLWSMLKAIGTTVKHGGQHSPLSHLPVRHVYLGGYSQSGVDTATFAAAFGTGTRIADGRPAYDGFFPACHAASMTPLAVGADGLPRFEHATMPAIGVPVVEVQPQTDVEGFSFEGFVNPGSASVRRDDSDTAADRFRLYEIGGAPHAAAIPGCDGPGSSYPMSAFVRAALSQLFRWAEGDHRPPRASRIALSCADTVAVAAVDQYGNAVGGVPSPFLDVPIARYDAHSAPGPLCQLAGREVPLRPEVLTERYGDVRTYCAEFTASLDAAIEAGFLLAQDRTELLGAQTAKARAAFRAIAASQPAAST